MSTELHTAGPFAPASRRVGSAANSRRMPWILLGLILLFVLFVRLRMGNVYLDRDEGEYAYSGQLILDGYPPYLHAYNMKLPGTYYAYALIMKIFGESARGIHVGFMLVNLATILFVFLLARRLSDEFAAVIASASFALLTLDENVFGLHAQATQFVVAFAVPAVLLLLHALERRSPRLIFFAGVCFGLAFLMKQHGVFFFLFAISAVLIEAICRQPRSATLFAALCAGFLLPYLAICLIMWRQGVFATFWFWTVRYAHAYVDLTTPAEALARFYRAFGVVTRYMLPLWLLSLVALVVLAFDWRGWRQQSLLLLFLIFSVAAIFPGLYFSEHYFILLFPALAVLIGAGMARLRARVEDEYPAKGAAIVLAMVLVAVGASLFRERVYFFQLPAQREARSVYAGNPYPEAFQIGKYIGAHSASSDRIVVLGSEPEIYFYAHRLAASGQVYAYGLLEKQPFAPEMQQQFIRETEAAEPKFAVYVGVAASWLPYNPQPAAEFDAWMRSFLAKYQIVGQIEIRSMQQTGYDWTSRPLTAPSPPPYGYQLLVYQRR